MQFIGISGPIASGKSTLANGLVALGQLQNERWIKESFAFGVKYLAGLYNAVDVEAQVYNYFRRLGIPIENAQKGSLMLIEAFKRYPVVDDKKPRELLQYIGTALGRQTLDEYLWITALRKRLDVLTPKPDVVVIDDIRFLNESHWVDVHIAIDTSESGLYAFRKNKLPAEYFNDHSSERQLLRIPYFSIQVDYTPVELIELYIDCKRRLQQL